MNAQARPGAADYGMLLLLALFWGSSFSLIKQTVGDFPPATMSMIRIFIAGLILLVVALWRGERIDWTPKSAAVLFLIGLFGNALPFSLIAWGQQVVDAGLASILMGVMPIATLLLAHFLTGDEPLTTFKLAGAVIGLFGLVILIGPSVLHDLGSNGIRELAILAAAISYGVNAILTKQMLGQPRRAAAAAILMCGALTLVPVSLATEDWSSVTPHAGSVAAILALAIFPTAIASLVVFNVIARQGAGFFGQINLLVPLSGAFLAVVFLGERLEPRAWAALAIIISGLAVARMSPLENRRKLQGTGQ